MSTFRPLMQRVRGSMAARRARPSRPGRVPPARRPSLENLEGRFLPCYVVTLLGTLGGPVIAATALNSCAVVGSADVDATHRHATFWGNFPSLSSDLGTLGGANSAALGVNAQGEVVG